MMRCFQNLPCITSILFFQLLCKLFFSFSLHIPGQQHIKLSKLNCQYHRRLIPRFISFFLILSLRFPILYFRSWIPRLYACNRHIPFLNALPWFYHTHTNPVLLRFFRYPCQCLIPHLLYRQYQRSNPHTNIPPLNQFFHAIHMIAVTMRYQHIVNHPNSLGFQKRFYPILPHFLHIAAASVYQISLTLRSSHKDSITLTYIQNHCRKLSPFSPLVCQNNNTCHSKHKRKSSKHCHTSLHIYI